MWYLLSKPKTLRDAYRLSTLLLRVAGIFPYYYDVRDFKFYFSWRLFLLTVCHISVYTYVNITFMLDDWRDYAQPLIEPSVLSAIGNLVLRLLGIFNTFLILGPVLVGRRYTLSMLNIFASLLRQCALLGIDELAVLRRIYSNCLAANACQICMVIFSSWHSVFYYERITRREPTFKFYVVVVLSNYYKMMFLFYTFMHLMSIYVMSTELNKSLQNLVRQEKKRYEREQLRRTVWVMDDDRDNTS